MRTASVFAIFLIPVLIGFAKGHEPFLTGVYLTHGSSIRLDGTTTVSSFSCSTSDVGGRGTINPIAGELEIYVRSFDCGIRRMNMDFRDALKTDDHEFIRFTIADAELVGMTDDGWSSVRARGTLDLAGVAREITVSVEAYRMEPGMVHLRGSHRLTMTEFGVTPPAKLLGMVRAHDDITVHFDLMARSY